MTDAWQKIGVARIVDARDGDPNSSGNTNLRRLIRCAGSGREFRAPKHND
jgi:hypothetical protein